MTLDHIGQLKPDPRNARRHTPRNVGMIADALSEVGASRSIVIDEDGVVLAGNATIEAAAQVGIERLRVVEADGNEIIAVQRKGLSKRDKKRLALFDNRAAELAEWEPEVLEDDKDILEGLFTGDELDALLASLSVDEVDDEQYSRKIKSPVYEPSNAKPNISDLFDEGKTRLLIDAINAQEELTDEERAFLIVAARRHTILHYNKIADYYAHASAPMQRLMEDSALVIIDFNRAIELGFVKLAEAIAEQYKADYGDD